MDEVKLLISDIEDRVYKLLKYKDDLEERLSLLEQENSRLKEEIVLLKEEKEELERKTEEKINSNILTEQREDIN